MDTTKKIVSLTHLLTIRQALSETKQKIVFTNGCFDLLHIGHVTYLEQAKTLGDILIVGLNTDQSVQRLKGLTRPILNESIRSRMMASLASVDYVVLFNEDTPYQLIQEIKPNILVKGGDYQKNDIVGYNIVEAYGGTVLSLSLIDGFSTTSLIEKIKRIDHD